jgi:hypothetical protein
MKIRQLIGVKHTDLGWEDNIKTDLKEMGFEYVDYIHLTG